MSDPQIDAAVAKLEAMRLDELTDLFDPAHLAVLVSVKAANRATFEKLMVRWKQMGFSAWHDLKIEVGQRWCRFLRQGHKVDRPMERTIQHEDTQTVYGRVQGQGRA